jgi:hypothetical protein
MQYELFFSYNLEENIDVIIENILKKEKPYKIICDNTIVIKKLKEKNINANPWKIATNDDYEISKKIYSNSKNILEKYLQTFNDIKFKDIEIFRAFDYSLLMQLSILSKAKIFLEEKQDIIFIFSSFFEIYFAFKEFFKEIGYSNNGKIGFIKNHHIDYFDLKQFREKQHYKNEFSQNRIKKFSKSLSGNKSTVKNIQNTLNLGSKISSYLFSKFMYKIIKSSNKDQIKNVLKKIDKKMGKNQNINTAFFLTTSRSDTYLKPWNSVFDRFKQKNYNFVILTSDFSTSMLLSKENIPFVSLFNEIKIIENELKHNEIGVKIKKEILEVISQNEKIIGLNELSSYFITQVFKVISILIIVEYILKKFDIKSTVALADGEILENISLQISKKNKIKNFSLLPVIVPPHAILTDWFHAEKIFVSGNNGVNSLINLGYDKNRLVITGNPLYDYTKNINEKKSKSMLKKQFKIDDSKKLIIIGTGEYHKNDEIWMSKFIKFCNQNNFEIIIKMHPKWKGRNEGLNLSKIRKECENEKFLISYDIDIRTALSAADLLITDYSNIGLEAICLEKPLITVNFIKENLDNILKYHDFGAALYFENYQKFEKSILEILNGNNYAKTLEIGRQKFIEEFNFANDGNASKRIFDLLVTDRT